MKKFVMIEISDRIWIDPYAVVAVVPSTFDEPSSWVYLRGKKHPLTIRATPIEVLKRISQKMLESGILD